MPNKTTLSKNNGTTLFWSIAEKMYADPKVEQGTMMGFKCLRVSGVFFATLDHRNDSLIVKLPKDRVLALVENGDGTAFVPNGRVFKEWVSISEPNRKQWIELLNEAKNFVVELNR